MRTCCFRNFPRKNEQRGTAGILDNLNFNQQSEIVYIGYFNRAADAGGFDFWSGENVRAQTSLKQSAPDAIKNIANSFTPQVETLAIYPFLSTTSFDPKNPATVASIGSLVDGIHANLFGRVAAAGDAGRQFWIDKILSGSVGIGESVLLIANGATGSDSNVLLNKINVALDFTTRTKAASIGTTTPASRRDGRGEKRLERGRRRGVARRFGHRRPGHHHHADRPHQRPPADHVAAHRGERRHQRCRELRHHRSGRGRDHRHADQQGSDRPDGLRHQRQDQRRDANRPDRPEPGPRRRRQPEVRRHQ